MIRKTVLENGITIITEKMDAHSVALGVWIKQGSMDEINKNGISHFYEHCVFKGAENFSAYDLVHQIESRGGYINAYTSREYTCFYSRIALENIKYPLDSICGMVNSPKLLESDFKKEKGVIIEEIKSYDDAPDELVQDLFTQSLWGKQAVAKPVAGSVSSVKDIKIADIHKHQKDVLNKNGLVVVVVGNVSHGKIVGAIKEKLYQKKSGSLKTRSWIDVVGKSIQRTRDIQQSHIVMGCAIKPVKKHIYALSILNIILGDGMASRLFQTIREDLGLAYSIYSGIDVYEFARVFSIYMATDSNNAQKAINAVKNEFNKILRDGIGQEELEHAKRNILGAMKMNLDSPSSRMNRIARNMMRFHKVVNVSEIEAGIKKVQLKDLMETAELVFRNSNWASAAVIPKGESKLKF